MTDTAFYVCAGMFALVGVVNTFHCIILGKRIDNLHERIRLTLLGNGLYDFWNRPPEDYKHRAELKITTGMSEGGNG